MVFSSFLLYLRWSRWIVSECIVRTRRLYLRQWLSDQLYRSTIFLFVGFAKKGTRKKSLDTRIRTKDQQMTTLPTTVCRSTGLSYVECVVVAGIANL